MVYAIDPGEKTSAIVGWNGVEVTYHDEQPNEHLLEIIHNRRLYKSTPLVIEWLEGYGLTVGQETFQTCRWVGRFEQAYWPGQVYLLSRRKVKQYLCANVSARDTHVRQALIDKIGEPGTKRNPGPLYGITGHKLAALAVAVTWYSIGIKDCDVR